MEEARQKIEELQKSIDALAVRRANVVNELGRLQQYLAGAARGGDAGSADISGAEGVENAADAEDEADERVEHEMTVTAMSAAPDPAGGLHQRRPAGLGLLGLTSRTSRSAQGGSVSARRAGPARAAPAGRCHP